MTKKFLLKVHALSDGDGPNLAVLELTPDLARTILKRRDVFLKLANISLCAMEYCGSPIEWYMEYPEIDDELLQAWEAEEPTPFNSVLTEDPTRTEVERMVITDDGMWWSAYLKHTSICMETIRVDYKFFEEFLKGPTRRKNTKRSRA
jgi:hypothetical protein